MDHDEMRNAMRRAQEPHISIHRAVELMTADDDWHPWLMKHGLDSMLCYRLTPMNETLTVWRADCYEGTNGVIVFTAGEEPETHSLFVETDPGKQWWLQ